MEEVWTMAVIIDKEICSGCLECYDVCPTDIFVTDEPGASPEVKFPEDCWYCGARIQLLLNLRDKRIASQDF